MINKETLKGIFKNKEIIKKETIKKYYMEIYKKEVSDEFIETIFYILLNYMDINWFHEEDEINAINSKKYSITDIITLKEVYHLAHDTLDAILNDIKKIYELVF